MKKYLKRGLAVLTCVTLSIQSPLAVLAEDVAEVQNEVQSENSVVQTTDLQTRENEIAVYAQAQAQWIKNSTGWWYQNADGSYPRNQWQMINGSWYHFDWNGYMQTGWLQLGNTWYYLNSTIECKSNDFRKPYDSYLYSHRTPSETWKENRVITEVC